jgi:Fe-Mn family superoxide dismutase
MSQQKYNAKKFELKGLKGISDETLKMHFGLYEGYVKNTNLLLEEISEITRMRKASGQDPAYAELTRRLGFEFGGMVLHEYYFENLAPGGKGSPSGELTRCIENCFQSF